MPRQTRNERGAPQRVALQEDTQQLSYNSLKVKTGQIFEEKNADLRWPKCIDTYKVMMKDATIAPALSLMQMYISKVGWEVKIPQGHEEELEDKAEFLRSCMKDMDMTWTNVISEAATMSKYGFAPIEKVFRLRKRDKGSRYDDGLYGVKSLPLISQDSIDSWMWDNDGRTLSGLQQVINIPVGKNKQGGGSGASYSTATVDIPRSKFILFRVAPEKNSPIGTSPLNSVYIAWRMKTELEKQEALSVSTDVRGLKVIYVPPQYLDPNATEEEKKTGEYFKKMLRSIHQGEQSGILLPNVYDDNGKKLFEFDVVSVMGNPSNDINEIISRYRLEIVTGLLNPQMVLGQGGSGSFALSSSLGEITTTVIQSRLREIKDQLNHDLVPHLFELNGWDTDYTPYFDFSDTDSISLDDLSKYVQRVASVGLLKRDVDTVNYLSSVAGMPVAFDKEPETREEFLDMLTGATSKSGEGMATGADNGEANTPASRDNSIANLEN